jgi:hypothetical protein
MKKKVEKLELVIAHRPFETVGEAVRHEVLEEYKKLLINEIADACIKGEPTSRLTRMFNQLK